MCQSALIVFPGFKGVEGVFVPFYLAEIRH
jgi:hypothetical protein